MRTAPPPVRRRPESSRCLPRESLPRDPSARPRRRADGLGPHPTGVARCSSARPSMSSIIWPSLEVLGRVDPGHALAHQDLGVLGRDDAAHHHRGVDPGGPQAVDHLGNQLEVRPREDGDADDVDVLVPGGGGDLGRREADALVDDLEPGIPGGHGDLLGAVGVAVEAGLGDQQLGRTARAGGQRLGPGQHPAELGAPVTDPAADAGGGPVLAEHLPEGAGPFAGGATGVGQGDGCRHDVLGALGRPPQLIEGPSDGGAVPSGPPSFDVGPELGLHGRVDPQDRLHATGLSEARGDSAVSVKQLTPTTWSSPVSMRRTRSAWLPTRRDLSSSMASKAPPSESTSSNSAHEASATSAVFFSMTTEPSKMSPYSSRSDSKARICWMRRDHCWSHGRGQAEGLVPRRELEGAGPGLLGQGDPERLEDDPRARCSRAAPRSGRAS